MRITRSAAGIAVGGASDGRGAWVCRGAGGGVDASCVERALAKRAFERAWRGEVSAHDAAVLRLLADRSSPAS